MKLSKRFWYALLGFLVTLNLTLRYYFLLPHEYGVDTFYIHSLTNTISEYGYAKWVITPASFFGLAPFSYPGAVPYMLSGLSQCTNLSVELIMLIVSMFCGIFVVFAAWLMAKEIRDDNFFAFIVAFAFSLSPIFLNLTIWSGSARQLFVALLPLFIWSLLRCRSELGVRWRYVTITILLFIVLLTIHRLGIFLIFVLIAYLITIFIYERGKSVILSKRIVRAIPVVCLILLAILVIPQFFKELFYGEYVIWLKYQSGYYFRGADPVIIFLNMLVDYGSKFGLLLIFVPIGLVSIIYRPKRVSKDLIAVYKAKRSFSDIFLIFVMIISAPLLTFAPYVLHVALPFFCILTGMGMKLILDSWKSIRKARRRKVMRKVVLSVIVAFMVGAIIFSGVIINHWVGLTGRATVPMLATTQWLNEKEYSSALFLKEYLQKNDTIITNYDLTAGRVSAISEVRMFSGAECRALAYGWVDKEQVKLKLSPLSEFFKGRRLYEPTEIEKRVHFDYISIRMYDVDSTITTRARYGVNHAVENQNLPIDWAGFVSSVHEKRYKIYDNGKQSIWYLGV